MQTDAQEESDIVFHAPEFNVELGSAALPAELEPPRCQGAPGARFASDARCSGFWPPPWAGQPLNAARS